MLLSAWLLVYSSAETPSEGSQNWAALERRGTGLEEGRAEWLTTSKLCFSVGLGWGIFPRLKIASPPF